MVRVAAISGYHAKVTLTGGPEKLVLDGVERARDVWRPARVEMAQPLAEALNAALKTLQASPSALHLLLAESLPANGGNQVHPAQVGNKVENFASLWQVERLSSRVVQRKAPSEEGTE